MVVGSNIWLQRAEKVFPAIEGLTGDLFSNPIWLSAYVKVWQEQAKTLQDKATPMNVLIAMTTAITLTRVIENNPGIGNSIWGKVAGKTGPSEEEIRAAVGKNRPDTDTPTPPRRRPATQPPPNDGGEKPKGKQSQIDPSFFSKATQQGIMDGSVRFVV